MKNLFFIFTLLVAPTVFAHGIDDADLSQPEKDTRVFGKTFSPDRIVEGASIQGVQFKMVRMLKGKEVPVEGINLKITAAECNAVSKTVIVKLEDTHFFIKTSGGTYELSVDLKCNREQKIIFDEKSPAGEIIALYETVFHAKKKLEESVGLEFWDRKIPVKFPSDGDYYGFGTLNITKGYQWDTVTHELGHGIYDLADIGQRAGGEHKIDECYSETLGFSEGWASFFAAYANLDLNDSDAKFEYMVPRRAPIQIENVPADVCGTEESEWRVFSFLWDLVDLHEDGETSKETFKKLWDATFNKKFGSIVEVKRELIRLGWNKDIVEIVWRLNFPGARRLN